MNAPSANFPQEIKPLTTSIHLLNKDVASSISPHLSDRDLLNLCLTSKELHSIFHPSLERRLTSYFLKFVVEGHLDKVEEILNRNKKLVFLQGDITDLSGREFKRTTAFQYAAWALDKEMWELILKYLPEIDAYDQLMAFGHKRLDITQIHGARFNFAPLLDAYQRYLDNYNHWYDANQWDQLAFCWCKEVGGGQRQMPAWFVYVFCGDGEDKAWPKGDLAQSFKRDPEQLSWWFDEEDRGGKLEVKLGAFRGEGWGDLRWVCWSV